jgi:hypothetical protein
VRYTTFRRGIVVGSRSLARALLAHGCGKALRLFLRYLAPGIPPRVGIGIGWAGRDAHRNRGDVLASLPEERLQGRLSAGVALRQPSFVVRGAELGD